MRTRGFDSADERKPGDGGFDLLLRRGSERHLLQCKHGGAYHVGEAPVRDLLGLMQTQGASGGILATTGRFDAGAHRAARNQPIDLLEGQALWRLLEPHLPDALLEQARELASAMRRRKALEVVLGAAAAGLATYSAAWYSLLPPAAPDVVAVAAEDGEPPARRAQPTLLTAPRTAALSASEERERRLDVIEEIAAIAGVVSVDWASKSTLAVALRGEEAATQAALAGVCDVLTRYDELRYSRIQVRPFETGRGDVEARVRWHKCSY